MKYISSLIIVLLFSFSSLSQQLKTPSLSPQAKVAHQIGLTEVRLEYSRPSAKGRMIFGHLVPFDKIWRTGANASTKIAFDEEIKIGRKPIKAGTYAVYTIPGQKKWTIIIHSNTKMRSLAGSVYKQENDVHRFEVEAKKTAEFVESFTLQFTDLRADRANLQLTWEHTLVNIPLELEVAAKIEQQMTALLADSENLKPRSYFEAAQFYLHNDKDLKKALKWINSALDKSNKNFRYGLLKAKILSKSGDHAGALNTIDQAYDWALKAENDNYIEQTSLFKKSLIDKN